MVDARTRLAGAVPKEVYTDQDIPGLGKNTMSEASLHNAIASYTLYIRYYALTVLKARLEAATKPAG